MQRAPRITPETPIPMRVRVVVIVIRSSPFVALRRDAGEGARLDVVLRRRELLGRPPAHPEALDPVREPTHDEPPPDRHKHAQARIGNGAHLGESIIYPRRE